jgi:hypothetical protein
MSRRRIAALVRQFSENGLKLLLEDPRNVPDLLAIIRVRLLHRIDFDRMTRIRTTFVQRDYRHVEADVVLRAPLRRSGPQRRQRRVMIYILIEHQSEPDALMAFRVLEYVVQIYKAQVRQWQRRRGSLRGLRFQPVLPIILYTGTRRWEALGRVADLVELAEEFTALIPTLDPLFVNLSALAPDQLESAGGFLGWVLRLVQERHARPAEFRELLRRVIEHLETMPAAERLRWLELLSYIHALVYHDRNPAEHAELQAEVDTSVRTHQHGQEVAIMGRTIADALRAEGRREGRKQGRMKEAVRARQQVLVRQLRHHFGELSPEVLAAIEAIKDQEQLDNCLDRVLTAKTLADVCIE